MPTTAARKPRPADVARWVAVLAAPEPSHRTHDESSLYAAQSARRSARAKLRSFGLGADGAPMATAAEVSL